ncbi:MAG: hypothetical protein JWR00_2824 [Rubritepida sp.]|nr:hypothetical protein [Rubritepida sp.]
MTGLLERMSRYVGGLTAGPLPLPTVATLPPGQCLPPGSADAEIPRDAAYFTLRVNELHLAQGRELWATYDPMVMIASTFIHGTERITVPFVVGPSLLKEHATVGVPHGVLVQDTTVAGPYPNRGGSISIGIVLYRVKRDDYARKLLQVVEGVSAAIGPAADMAVLSKVGGPMIDGLEALLGLGATVPVAGHRIEYDTMMQGGLRSWYAALIDAPHVDTKSLRVDRGRLTRAEGDGWQPVRDADYVLYSLSGHPRREDERTLPFYALYQRAVRDAASGTDEAWKAAKATLAECWQQMAVSPDLTPGQAGALIDGYRTDLLAARDRARKLSELSGHPAEVSAPREAARLATASVLLDL